MFTVCIFNKIFRLVCVFVLHSTKNRTFPSNSHSIHSILIIMPQPFFDVRMKKERRMLFPLTILES